MTILHIFTTELAENAEIFLDADCADFFTTKSAKNTKSFRRDDLPSQGLRQGRPLRGRRIFFSHRGRREHRGTSPQAFENALWARAESVLDMNICGQLFGLAPRLGVTSRRRSQSNHGLVHHCVWRKVGPSSSAYDETSPRSPLRFEISGLTGTEKGVK